MTFPSPFDEASVPALAEVDDSLAKTGQLVTYLAQKLREAAEASIEQTSRTLAKVKGRLTKPVTASIADTQANTVDRIAMGMLNHIDNSLADTDARIMMLAPRLGARRDAAALGALPSTPPAAPVATAMPPAVVGPAGGTILPAPAPRPTVIPIGGDTGPPGLGCQRPTYTGTFPNLEAH